MPGSVSSESASAPRCPDGMRIYAIGDIHGRDDLLIRLHELIRKDARARPEASLVAVYLGDYVDRGTGSFEVIDLLLNEPLAGFANVHLKGNHEDMMLRFLDGPASLGWLLNGGVATLASYGVAAGGPMIYLADLDALRRELLAAMPADHLRFLLGLEMMHIAGDYAFVHAGVRPRVALAAQQPADLMWIRDKFLRSGEDFGKVVVHGHTIADEPEMTANRIGIDTGAFASDRLTCLVLEGSERRFLRT
ncbi:MAG: serine/threonine protein phosphatase [Rhodospirillales bacterium]|nr:serine/threonine protein phosphatase [Rhodospirillales bacterium]